MSRYLKNKIVKGYQWGALKCLNREILRHKRSDGPGITITSEENYFTLECRCGAVINVWDEDLDPKKMDCGGCGIWQKEQDEIRLQQQLQKGPRGRPRLGEKCRVSKVIFFDPDVLEEVDKFGSEQRISRGEAVHRLLQVGLGNVA